MRRRLLRMSQTKLDRLFRDSLAGELPHGRFKGTFLVAPGTVLNAATAELIRLFAWQGKVFDAEHGRLNNLVLPPGFEAVPARVYIAPSRFDGNECIVLDYSETSFVARWVRDEIREIAHGVYLGKTYFAEIGMPDFVLERKKSSTVFSNCELII